MTTFLVLSSVLAVWLAVGGVVAWLFGRAATLNERGDQS